MERIAFFDAKPYDRIYFDKLNLSILKAGSARNP